MKKVKIGIRPIIDGRRKGIRESLEEMTMSLARKVAELYSSTLKYPDGSSVECVIADTCIGGVKEAAMCAEKFEKENVGLTVSVTPCWCYGSETIDMNPLKLFGDSMQRKDLVLFISLRHWLLITKKVCRHLVFMEKMFKIWITWKYQMMLKKNCCVLQEPDLR